jgi:3',5'-cyclic AMP phosphodiesterase CpdA
MSDPQFGMYTKDQDFIHETANFDFAVAAANRVKPAFVVITGDLVNKDGDAGQIAEYLRISKKLDPKIRLFHVAGNHDVGNEPTPESLAKYRKAIGPDYYTFQAGDITGIVIDSSLLKAPQKVSEEAAKMETWLQAELAKARQSGAKNIIVFQHIPFFLKEPGEPDQYFNIPMETRKKYLKLMHDYGVKAIFAGHYHRNEFGKDGDMEMVTTGPVGMPQGGGKSGLRIVTVDEKGVTHKYYEFGDLP